MKKSARIILGTALILLLIGAGLATGVYFYKQGHQHKESVAALQQTAVGNERVSPPEARTYLASPPSQGVAVTTTEAFPLKAVMKSAVVFLPAEENRDIKNGQRVLLYDESGALLDILGEVRNVQKGNGDFSHLITMAIHIDDTLEVSASLVRSAEIITGKDRNASRLPPEALVKDENGQSFVWIAEDSQAGPVAKRVEVSPAIMNSNFFTVDDPASTSKLYILNPDAALKNGQRISIQKKLFWGQEQADDERIQAMRNREIERRMAEYMENQIPQVYNPNCPMNCSLQAPPGSEKKSFIDMIREMALRLPGKDAVN